MGLWPAPKKRMECDQRGFCWRFFFFFKGRGLGGAPRRVVNLRPDRRKKRHNYLSILKHPDPVRESESLNVTILKAV